MKTNFRKFISVIAIAATAITVTLVSCSKDEVTSIPEEVESTIEEAYYISGVVSSTNEVLANVAVSAGNESTTTDAEGVYTLKMSSADQVTVNFSKDGYVSISATAIFEVGTKTGTVLTLSQELSARVETQQAVAGEESELVFGDKTGSEIVISIPAEALEEDTNIAVTDFVATATPATVEALTEAVSSGNEQTVTGALVAVYLEPSGTTFETPVTISIPGDYIEGAYHAKLIDDEWVKQGEATYNTLTNAYEIQVEGFSQHSIAVDSIISITSTSSEESTVTLAEEVFDNLGQVSAVSKSVSYNQYSGWELISGSTLSSYVASIMGSSESAQTIAKTLDVNVAGDQKVTITIIQQATTTTFSAGTLEATAKSYGNVSIYVEIEQGDLRPDHNA